MLIGSIYTHKFLSTNLTSEYNEYSDDISGDGCFPDECAMFSTPRARSSGPVGSGATRRRQ